MKNLALNKLNYHRMCLLRASNKARDFLNFVRNKSGCFDDQAKCPKGRIMNTPCEDNQHEFPPRKLPKKEEFVSMWANPLCEPSAATCQPARFDTLYYKPSDKATRQYQQTWVECPARLCKPNLVCEFPQEDQLPPIARRPKRVRLDTAKCMDLSKLRLASCSRQKDLKQNKSCLKITLPGCRGVRPDIRCKLFREPANCKIIPNPYPSYSECTHPKTKPRHPTECECMKIRSMCDIWTILRQKAVL